MQFALFESSVILEGSKTIDVATPQDWTFESSVILEGSKTVCKVRLLFRWFESSVILEGSKTPNSYLTTPLCLRVVLF